MMKIPPRFFEFLLFFLTFPVFSQSLAFHSQTEPVLFQRFLESEKDVASLQSHWKAVMESSLPELLKNRYLTRLAVGLELQGRFSEALEVVLKQQSLTPSSRLTVKLGYLALETGNLEEAQAAAHLLSGDESAEFRIQGAVLQSRIWRIQGQEEAASRIMKEAAADVEGLPGVLYLWESFQVSDPSRKTSITSLSGRLYPGSPESVLMQDPRSGTVKLWGTRIPSVSSMPPVTSPSEKEEFLQLGAYGLKANAQSLMEKLPTDLRAEIVESGGLFRVFVAATPENKTRLSELKIPFILKKK